MAQEREKEMVSTQITLRDIARFRGGHSQIGSENDEEGEWRILPLRERERER